MPNALARLRAALLCAALILVVLPAAASARLVKGTGTSDTLQGTASADTIKGLGGADVINGLGGADRIYGGRERTASPPTARTASAAVPAAIGSRSPRRPASAAAR